MWIDYAAHLVILQHSLAWTLALLAAYPEYQEMAYQEIMENDPSGESTIADYPKFRFLLASYYETLRMFPPVQQIPKVVAEDMEVVVESSNEIVPESPLLQEAKLVVEKPVFKLVSATPMIGSGEEHPSFDVGQISNHSFGDRSSRRRLTIDLDAPQNFSSGSSSGTSATVSPAPNNEPQTPTRKRTGIAISIPTTPKDCPPVTPSGSALHSRANSVTEPWRDLHLRIPHTPRSSLSAPSGSYARGLQDLGAAIANMEQRGGGSAGKRSGSSGARTPGSGFNKFEGPMPYKKVDDKKDLLVKESQTSFVVKKGVIVMVSPPAVRKLFYHVLFLRFVSLSLDAPFTDYNPKYWENPNKFDPERFLRPYCHSAFIPFVIDCERTGRVISCL